MVSLSWVIFLQGMALFCMTILPLSTPLQVKMLKTMSTRTTKCQPLDADAVPYCANVGYDMVALPNSKGHNTQQEAFEELQNFWPLISTGCSGAAVHFLCSVYLPPCLEDSEEVVKPCRELCDEFQGSCEAELVDIDVQNLTPLQCSQFLSRDEDSKCYGPDPTALTTPAIAKVNNVEASEMGTCRSIEAVPLCRNLGYDNFSLPNQRGHSTIEEMNSELNDFLYFVQSECSNSILHFLCYYFAPPCTDEHSQLGVQPCRELCEYTRDNCLKAFDGLGISWPQPMDCSNFLYKNETDACSGPSDPATLVIPESAVAGQDAATTEVVLEPSSASGLLSRTSISKLRDTLSWRR